MQTNVKEKNVLSFFIVFGEGGGEEGRDSY